MLADNLYQLKYVLRMKTQTMLDVFKYRHMYSMSDNYLSHLKSVIQFQCKVGYLKSISK